MLRLIKQSRLEAASKDKAYRDRVEKVHDKLEAYLNRKTTWFTKNLPKEKKDQPLVAYFSAEFGFHESLPVYSGGLGILAGDHCKSASDLGLPFVAVGLLYRFGYFSQRINRDGWQEASIVDNVFHNLPVREALGQDGKTPVVVELDMPGRKVKAKVWEVRIGLTRLFLLDTDLASNGPDDRNITYQLYGGDHDMRVRQEIVLGIGGVKALDALGLQPSVFHMNEGHAAFLGLERIRMLISREKLSFIEALQSVAASSLFMVLFLRRGLEIRRQCLLGPCWRRTHCFLSWAGKRWLGASLRSWIWGRCFIRLTPRGICRRTRSGSSVV
jgi:starch phosphorylase